MDGSSKDFACIRRLTPEDIHRIEKIPFLNIDSLLIPSPYIKDKHLDVDYEHSYVWDEEGEFLGYILVYANPEKNRFQVYKQVTSPFGRGKRIGSTFLRKLAHDLRGDSYIYLFVWEKLASTIDFFYSHGFALEEATVYRKMRFYMMSAQARTLRQRYLPARSREISVIEELSKVRHDAKKSLKVLSDMISILSVDNFNQIIEDINRENTALLNTLSMYKDKIKASHEVNIKEIISTRVIPFIEAANAPCEIRLIFGSGIPPVIGRYMDYSRALINLVSNSIDAIEQARRDGLIMMMLTRKAGRVVLVIQDNGVGIDSARLAIGENGLPGFVGRTSKPEKTGEGIGTRQIFSTFGANNILVESREGKFTRWIISLNISTRKKTDKLDRLETRFVHFAKVTETIGITSHSSRTEISSFIWQLRQMEVFVFELIHQFSRYNNVRDIYRSILLFRYGGKDFNYIKQELEKCRTDSEMHKYWLLGMLKRIKRNETFLQLNSEFDEYKGIYFKSYGQAIRKNIIFTLDPDTGRFLATDRRLAEHLDFVPFLGRKRDQLLRGEFKGDVKNLDSPIYLGVWSVINMEDLHDKIALVRQGARQLIAMGLKKEKKLAFYNVTRNLSRYDFNTFKIMTLEGMADMKRENFDQLITATDEEFEGLVFAD
jgi:ribosomal protein S18 acetylase RimI-like enzyme